MRRVLLILIFFFKALGPCFVWPSVALEEQSYVWGPLWNIWKDLDVSGPAKRRVYRTDSFARSPATGRGAACCGWLGLVYFVAPWIRVVCAYPRGKRATNTASVTDFHASWCKFSSPPIKAHDPCENIVGSRARFSSTQNGRMENLRFPLPFGWSARRTCERKHSVL